MKHRELIIRWANGARVEWYSKSQQRWVLTQEGCYPPFLSKDIKLREHVTLERDKLKKGTHFKIEGNSDRFKVMYIDEKELRVMINDNPDMIYITELMPSAKVIIIKD